jgi:hypothetical protein
MGAWDPLDSTLAQPDRPDLFQAMVAAGMVTPSSSTPIQRTSDAQAKIQSEAINRAEAVTPQSPDIFQALRAAGMVSDANAASLQRVSNAEQRDTPHIGQIPVNAPLQRALDNQPEVQAETGGNEKENEGIPHDIDVDRLAHDVYRVLREKLRVNAERRPK